MKIQKNNIMLEEKFLNAIELLRETCNLDSDTIKVLTIKYACKIAGTCWSDEYRSVLSDIRLKITQRWTT